jgi:hypothetical protein
MLNLMVLMGTSKNPEHAYFSKAGSVLWGDELRYIPKIQHKMP